MHHVRVKLAIAFSRPKSIWYFMNQVWLWRFKGTFINKGFFRVLWKSSDDRMKVKEMVIRQIH